MLATETVNNMEKNGENIKNELLTDIANKSVMNQLVNIVFVEENPCILKTESTKIVDGVVTVDKTEDVYTLDKHRLIIKDSNYGNIVISDELDNPQTIMKNVNLSDCASMRINKEFISKIDNLEKLVIKKWSYFNRNFLNKLLSIRTECCFIKKIIEESADYNWIIVNQQTYDIIKKSNFFIENNLNSDCLIKNMGILKIGLSSVVVYLNPGITKYRNVYLKNNLVNAIYFGKYSSMSILINKDVEIKRLKSNSDSYSLTLQYKFIEGDPIKCLII